MSSLMWWLQLVDLYFAYRYIPSNLGIHQMFKKLKVQLQIYLFLSKINYVKTSLHPFFTEFNPLSLHCSLSALCISVDLFEEIRISITNTWDFLLFYRTAKGNPPATLTIAACETQNVRVTVLPCFGLLEGICFIPKDVQNNMVQYQLVV